MAHYNFESLIVNGKGTEPYEYVRQTTNANSPIEDITSENMICNQGGLDADIRAKTSTFSVAPGDEVGFVVNSELGHPGPLAVYLSKAPDGTEASDYLGDGDWFKVYSLTTSDITDAGLQWATYVNNAGIHNFTFALPDSLPSGNYLMRAEHIALHAAGSKGGAQFYMGCAQLKVEGSGSGTPTDTVKFPGAYDGSEPGILINLYYPAPTSYTAPGPAVWPSSCEDHTANFAGQATDGDCTGSDGSEAGSGSGSGSGSNSTTPVETPVASPSSTFATLIPTASVPSNGTVVVPTTAVTPVAISTAVPAAESTAVVSEAPVATPTGAADSCAAKRKARKVRRAGTRAAKRSFQHSPRRVF
ncbi:hypothetical protein QQZ08_010756 [Neonectria magnoliae]|uniref:lytic cellulose monooxygenase (C4-dehydrogenating) n=1 Tax=Neonectria magnoliae TaxID=2732573 RepID=A0ABR1HEV7_9HYPO